MKAFLSSTYVDLAEHRRAAADAIARLGHQAGGMEVFGARPEDPSQACIGEIDDCDLFVGIYAHRYGYIPPGSTVSITEIEFDRARENRKPVFCFFVDEDHPWPPRLCDDEPGKSQLRALKNKIGQTVVRDTFTTPTDLAYRLGASLGRYLSAGDRINGQGGLRASADTSPAEFFGRIMSEITALRLELQGQKELLAKVNRMDGLLRPSDLTADLAALIDATLPSDLAGCWRDTQSGSTLYAGYVGTDLFVPYSYSDDTRMTGVFFDFQQRSKDVLFARFKWVTSPIQGFAYIQRTGPDAISGGWWYAQDLPIEALQDLKKLSPRLPRMNDLNLIRLRQAPGSPQWAIDFFARSPSNASVRRLLWGA
jgi:hypothetical protein